jgi:hypothetical protein
VWEGKRVQAMGGCMPAKTPPGLWLSVVDAVARQFGSRNQVILVILFTLWISLNLFSSGVDKLVEGVPGLRSGPWGAVVRMLPLVILIGIIYRGVQRAKRRIRLRANQDDNPQTCEALILFLSPPGKDASRLKDWLTDTNLRCRVADKIVRERFQGSWRMPLEAIGWHVGRLKKIVIIPSCDDPLDPKKKDGTFRNLTDWRLLLNWFLPFPERIEIRDVTEPPFNRPVGVDFEKLQELFDVLEEIIRWLNEGGTKDYEIMIDITGGQKVPGVAGAAVALGEGRRFQYVSTRDYRVHSYDPTYNSDE